MQDFARLRVRCGIVGLGLIGGEPPQHALRDARIEPQHLQRGDQPIAAEGGRVPGDAGVGIASLRRAGHEHVEIGHRAAQHLIEEVVRGLDRGGVARNSAPIAMDRAQAARERYGFGRFRRAAGDGAVDRRHLLGRKGEAIRCRRRRDLGRRRLEAQHRLPQLGVQSLVAQDGGVRADRLAGAGAAAFPLQAAHLEQVGEIAVEQHRQAQIDRTIAMVLDPQPLIGRVAPEKNRAHDMHGVLGQNEAMVEIHVGIGQIDGQLRIVVAHVGAEQQRLRAVEQKLEMREKTRVAMKQPVDAAGRCAHITVAVENEEGIVVLEGAARARRRARRRNIERRLGNNFERQFRERGAHTRHESPVSSCLFPAPAAASAGRSRAPAAPAA